MRVKDCTEVTVLQKRMAKNSTNAEVGRETDSIDEWENDSSSDL